jgi:hypothetical protein
MGVAEFTVSMVENHEDDMAKKQAREQRSQIGRTAFGIGQRAVHAAFKAEIATEKPIKDQYPEARTITLPEVAISEGVLAVISRTDRREASHTSRNKFKTTHFSLAIKSGEAQKPYAEIDPVGDIKFETVGEHTYEDYEEVATIFQVVADDIEARIGSE